MEQEQDKQAEEVKEEEGKVEGKIKSEINKAKKAVNDKKDLIQTIINRKIEILLFIILLFVVLVSKPAFNILDKLKGTDDIYVEIKTQDNFCLGFYDNNNAFYCVDEQSFNKIQEGYYYEFLELDNYYKVRKVD